MKKWTRVLVWMLSLAMLLGLCTIGANALGAPVSPEAVYTQTTTIGAGKYLLASSSVMHHRAYYYVYNDNGWTSVDSQVNGGVTTVSSRSSLLAYEYTFEQETVNKTTVYYIKNADGKYLNHDGSYAAAISGAKESFQWMLSAGKTQGSVNFSYENNSTGVYVVIHTNWLNAFLTVSPNTYYFGKDSADILLFAQNTAAEIQIDAAASKTISGTVGTALIYDVSALVTNASGVGGIQSIALKTGSVLPDGLTLGTDGKITGTPSRLYPNGSSAVLTITAKNGKTAEVTLLFVIKANPTVTLANKTVTYNAKAQGVDAAVVTGMSGYAAPTGNVTYTYYTDSACTVLTYKGSAGKEGTMPADAGVYYVKAAYAGDSLYSAKTSAAAILTIKKVDLNIALANKTADFTGAAIDIGAAKVTGWLETAACPISYTYYLDADGRVMTTAANSGAASNGAAPVAPGTYYVIASFAGNGNYNGNASKAMLKISSAHTYYMIYLTLTGKGTASPAGNQYVPYGGSMEYTFTPATGYYIKDVLVDGKSVGAVKTYAFKNVSNIHTIEVIFKSLVWENPFRDVYSSDWFYGSIQYVYENGLMMGSAGSLFEPYTQTTRGMIVTTLWRLSGTPYVTKHAGFSDVPKGYWADDAIDWAYANGIALGYGDGQFCPEQIVTREELCAFLYRYAKFKGLNVTTTGNLSAYTDANQVAPWFRTDVAWAVEKGLLQGVGNGKLDPKANATRAELAALLQRYSLYLLKK